MTRICILQRITFNTRDNMKKYKGEYGHQVRYNLHTRSMIHNP